MADEQVQEQDAYLSLNERQRRFVDAYVGEARCNATEAARLAGYSDASRVSLAKQGSRMYRNVQIQRAISERVDQFAMTAEEVLSNIADIARNSSIADMLDTETYGKPKIVLVEKGTTAIKETVRKYLKRLSITEEGVSIEVYDRFAALVQLGKFHRIWIERSEITGQNGNPIQLMNLGGDTSTEDL